MNKRCLKCGYVRTDLDTALDYECPKCGAVYAKVEAAASGKAPDSRSARLNRQINKLDGVSRWSGSKELKELPQILWEDEEVENIVQGIYASRNGIAVSTDRRLIFLDKGLMYGLRVEDFAYDKITSIQYQTGLVFGEITIFASGNRAEIKQIPKDQVRPFAENVRARLSSNKAQLSQAKPEIKTQDLVSQLERLAQLRASGVLTEEEFQVQKARILNP